MIGFFFSYNFKKIKNTSMICSSSEVNNEMQEILNNNQSLDELQVKNDFLSKQLAAAEKKFNEFQTSISQVRIN